MSSNSKLDITDKTWRYIMTPDGKAEIDFFILGNTGHIECVMVWLGEKGKKWMRPHVRYPVDECYELED